MAYMGIDSRPCAPEGAVLSGDCESVHLDSYVAHF